MSGERDKKTVLDLVNHSRATFEAAVARYDDDQLVNVISPHGWNLKDMMAHITSWEAYAVDRFAEVSRGEKPRTYGHLTEEDTNRINQEFLEAGRKQTLDEVKVDFKRVHQNLVAAIEAMPEDTTDPWWSIWPDHELPWQLIHYNTWGHYDEHMHDLQNWLAARD